MQRKLFFFSLNTIHWQKLCSFLFFAFPNNRTSLTWQIISYRSHIIVFAFRHGFPTQNVTEHELDLRIC